MIERMFTSGIVRITCKGIVATSDVSSIERNLAANNSRKGNSNRACKIKKKNISRITTFCVQR